MIAFSSTIPFRSLAVCLSLSLWTFPNCTRYGFTTCEQRVNRKKTQQNTKCSSQTKSARNQVPIALSALSIHFFNKSGTIFSRYTHCLVQETFAKRSHNKCLMFWTETTKAIQNEIHNKKLLFTTQWCLSRKIDRP